MKPIFNSRSKMRTTTLTGAFVLMATAMVAQPKEVVNAYNYMKGQEWMKAADAIDKAIVDASTSDKEKTWRYRGDIYLGMAMSQNQSDRDLRPDPIGESIRSYKKSMDLGTKYEQEIKERMMVAHNASLNGGVENFNASKLDKALMGFENAVEVSKILNFKDTLAHFNAALTAEKLERFDVAVGHYETLLAMNHQPEKMYSLIVYGLKSAGKNEQALAKLAEGRAKYPENQDLIIQELNHYLINDDMEGAKRNLQKAIEKDPNNHVLHYSIGTVYNSLGNTDEAEAAYKKSISLNPEYFDAQYNLGALYFNKGAALFMEADKIQDQKKYKVAVDGVNEVFKLAIPYLEKAHEINPADTATMDSLMKLYVRVGEDDKYIAMKKKLEKK